VLDGCAGQRSEEKGQVDDNDCVKQDIAGFLCYGNKRETNPAVNPVKLPEKRLGMG